MSSVLQPIIARQDPALRAEVVQMRPLLYNTGADAALDRPAHVRAASGIAQMNGRLVVIQDDAHFVAVFDPQQLEVQAWDLPVGPDGRRQFDDLRGNKRHKLDLEACLAIEGEQPRLVAFGSGSSPVRERLVVVDWQADGVPVITSYDAPAWYALLRQTVEFAGSELNIEGAILVDDTLCLFQRGNGAPRETVQPVDATCELSWSALWAYLRQPDVIPPPQPGNIVQYQLGAIYGCRLSFTDATLAAGTVLFTASAEASPDAQRDGPVMGSVLGVLNGADVRWAILCDQDGAVFEGKVEGISLMPDDLRRAWIVVDRDDPSRPSDLCEVVLQGPWYETSGH